MAKKSTRQRNIDAQEEKDRYVAIRCMEETVDLQPKQALRTVPTNVKSHIDLVCVITDWYANPVKWYDIEIKERNKTRETVEKYPYAELKVSKYNNMLKDKGPNSDLLYIVLLNQKLAFIFNLSTLDWSKVQRTTWTIKEIQYEEGSETRDTEVYLIPYTMADRMIGCEQYYTEYEQYTQSITKSQKKTNRK
jgi:hypothetical protein